MSKSKFLPVRIVHFGKSGAMKENKRFSLVLRFPVCKGMGA